MHIQSCCFANINLLVFLPLNSLIDRGNFSYSGAGKHGSVILKGRRKLDHFHRSNSVQSFLRRDYHLCTKTC